MKKTKQSKEDNVVELQEIIESQEDLTKFSLTKLLDDSLLLKRKEEDEKKASQFWRASEIGMCMRKALFRRLGIEGTPLSARELKVLKIGELFHEFMQSLTKKAGLSIEQELFLEDLDFEYRGKIDDIVKIGDELYVFEYKTEHSKSFDWRQKLSRGVSEHHIVQAMSYVHFLIKKYDKINELGKIRKVRWIYISKDDMRMDELEMEYTPEWGKFVENILKTLSNYYKNKKLPRAIDFKNDKQFGWQCAKLERYGLYKGKYKPLCPYFKYCREKNDDYNETILTPQIFVEDNVSE